MQLYPALTNFMKSRLYQWGGDVENHRGKEGPCIEVVCSPNNPDGLSKQAVLTCENGKIIHDLTYYWPQYTAITAAADHDIMLFTLSKITGHAGIRIGWALVKDDKVARKMIKFIEMNTIGVSKDSQLRAARILSFVTNSHANPSLVRGVGGPFFHYARRTMTERWNRLRDAVQRSNGALTLTNFPSQHCNFTDDIVETHPGKNKCMNLESKITLHDFTFSNKKSPAFAWMKCEKEGVDFQGVLKEHNIITLNGEHFGVENCYVRISMLDIDPYFDIFIKRISTIY